MKNSILKKIWEWKKHFKLNQPQSVYLLECFRRFHMFHNGKINETTKCLLAYPSEAKKISDFIKPGEKQARILHWYSLNKKGIEIVKDLNKRITWNEKEMNLYFFTWDGLFLEIPKL